MSTERLLEKRQTLKEQMSRYQEYSVNLVIPGWVEKHLETRGPQFTNRLPNLKLEGVDPITYFDRLTGPVRKLQERFQRRYVRIGERLSKLEDEIKASIAPKNAHLVVRGEMGITVESLRIANRILELIPASSFSKWKVTGELNPATLQKQALSFAQYAIEVKMGKVKPVSFSDIVTAPANRKAEVAKIRIRQALAPLILTDSSAGLEKSERRWAIELRALLDFLGKDGNEHLAQAIDELPEVENAIVLSIISIETSQKLGFIDLDQCGEERVVTYIRNTCRGSIAARDDNLGTIIETAVERGSNGTIDLSQLAKILSEVPEIEYLFKDLLESAKLSGFRDYLREIFSSHTESYYLAKKVEDSLFADDEEEFLPQYRISESIEPTRRAKIWQSEV